MSKAAREAVAGAIGARFQITNVPLQLFRQGIEIRNPSAAPLRSPALAGAAWRHVLGAGAQVQSTAISRFARLRRGTDQFRQKMTASVACTARRRAGGSAGLSRWPGSRLRNSMSSIDRTAEPKTTTVMAPIASVPEDCRCKILDTPFARSPLKWPPPACASAPASRERWGWTLSILASGARWS